MFVVSVPFYDQVRLTFFYAAPELPPEYWWVAGGVLFILALTATIDAFTETIPEKLIFFGLFAITAIQGMVASWELAAHHLQQAVAMGFLIWAINVAWFSKFRYDALGMGDAKWTMLATACFGIDSALIAWGIGSVLATILIGLFRLFKYQLERVTFSPFLFVGLSVAICWKSFT